MIRTSAISSEQAKELTESSWGPYQPRRGVGACRGNRSLIAVMRHVSAPAAASVSRRRLTIVAEPPFPRR